MQIVTTPNEILVKKSETVKKFDKKLKEIVRGMEKALLATTDPKGVGLAAPQVGLSLCIFQMKPNEKTEVKTFINPEIISGLDAKGILDRKNSENVEANQTLPAGRQAKNSKGKLLEGCLSIPNIWGNVTRKKEVTLSWQDEEGKKYQKTFKGFPAIIIQHEIDHLNGVLFTKHVMEQKEKLYRSHRNEKGVDEFEEVNV